nr:hypothetical protein [uncultured Desulfobacter sp.]
MEALKTKYGTITGYQNLEKYESGNPASLIFTEQFEIKTPVGAIIPQYEVDDHGRRVLKPVTFYENGQLKKAPLQMAADIETKYGNICAELVMFYDDGSLKKLFPLNGKLSGYWGEKDEVALAKELELALSCGTIKAKPINLVFYKSGNIKSITLWPQETVDIQTPLGAMRVHVGISFYEDGSVKSVEPVEPHTVETKIGPISAYDNDPEGIMGDINSLQFDEQGEVTALSTTKNAIVLKNPAGGQIKYAPSEKESLCSENVSVTIPLQIEFTSDTIRFNHSASEEYNLSECSVEVIGYGQKALNPFFVCNCS